MSAFNVVSFNWLRSWQTKWNRRHTMRQKKPILYSTGWFFSFASFELFVSNFYQCNKVTGLANVHHKKPTDVKNLLNENIVHWNSTNWLLVCSCYRDRHRLAAVWTQKKNLFVLATRTTHSLCNVQNYSPICRRASTAHLWIIFNMETQKTQRNCIICSHSVTCCYFIRALNSWVAFHHNSINVNEMNVMTLSQNSSISLGIFAFKCEITNHENRYRSNASHHHIRFCQTIQQRAI